MSLSRETREGIAEHLRQTNLKTARIRAASGNPDVEALIDALADVIDGQSRIIAELAEVQTDGENYWVE